jgi:hypothetical protein
MQKFACLAFLGSVASAAFDCSFSSSQPRQYVAYNVSNDDDLVIDGKLDDPAWQEVGFTDAFVDIATSITPEFRTRAKIRWNDKFLFVGAMIEDPHVWANISTTCHCLNNSQDQVIFREHSTRPTPLQRLLDPPCLSPSHFLADDNDFEVFV